MMGFAINEGLEVQAEMRRVADDPRPPRDGLVVDDSRQLQELRHRLHGLGGRPLHANEVDVSALDRELGLFIEQVSANHLNELEP
jgi:hypothetical protein